MSTNVTRPTNASPVPPATPAPRAPIDLEAIRRRLVAAEGGRNYWRSLEELTESAEIRDVLAREFPRQTVDLLDSVDRRQFLKLMGASLALAGLSACTRQPAEQIMPYVRAPEEIVPGEPLYFASAVPLAGVAAGVLVESHMGRPTKIEGNPEHPASLGATDSFTQAAVLGLYDPDRSQVITSAGEIRPWSAFVEAMRGALATQRERRGAGLRILTETVTSPSLAQLLRELLTELPAAKWHQYEPAGRDEARAGARLAFGQYLDTQYRFDKADVVVALDADFLACGPGSVRYARDFSRRRRLEGGRTEMSRLYAAESTPTVTGARADQRLPLRASAVEDLARAIAAGVGVKRAKPPEELEAHAEFVASVVRDLHASRGRGIVLAGDQQPAMVHALAHLINDTLGNAGRTVIYTEPVDAQPVDHMTSLRELVADMDAGEVEMLLILGGNPVLTAPADLGFGVRLAKVGFRVHLGLYDDETSLLCHWHVPEAHVLEAWSDARAYDGTATIIQPLIAPLYDGRTAHQVLAALGGKPDAKAYDLVREYWKRQYGAGDFESYWRKAVHDGVVPGSARPQKGVTFQSDWLERPPARRTTPELEIVFRPDPSVFDGRFANNGWLQELPRPITTLTWDNAALIAPATAARLRLASEDVVELRYHGRVVRAPVWVTPGHAADSITVHVGYGRTRAGRVGTGVGFDAYAIRTSDAPWIGRGVEVRKTGETFALASAQRHHTMEGRHLVRAGTLEDYRAHPWFAREMEEAPAREMTLYPPHPYEGYAWGMAIDLSACTGCNACVIACQAENNIAVVGKDQVARGREMHWLRVDRYYEGDPANPVTHHQPVPCMHCENAPCEVVCPVNATVHSNEGLNDMVYNRCVGTKYCSNNCPYKVRRFNFHLYSDWTTESVKLQRNPDVTVRSRGVMEKCTYCVQRINAARIQAGKEDRRIRDGEVVTACQQVCPAEAIVFGDLNDPTSRVAKLKQEPRTYALLGELNTRPRTTYLASVRNPSTRA